MESQRNLLIVGLLFVSFLLYTEWQTAQNPVPQQIEQSLTKNAIANTDVPASSNATVQGQALVTAQQNSQLVTVSTDLIKLTIDTLGGDIVESELLEYPVELNGVENLRLLEQQQNFTFVAQSG